MTCTLVGTVLCRHLGASQLLGFEGTSVARRAVARELEECCWAGQGLGPGRL